MRLTSILLLTCATLAHGQIVVDPSGTGGAYTSIPAAMASAAPGDSILVMPGSYPAFQFSRGVKLIGMGAAPGDVVIQRIAYHVSIPAQGYDSLISNVTVRSAHPLDVLSIHGNELPPGTLTLDGCVLENGVFLRGGQQGFYLMINNCRIEPPAGHGFSGEACWLGGPGNWVDIRNTRIRGWDADASSGIPAGVGLRIAGGTLCRVAGSDISGGDGAVGTNLAAGAAAILSTPPGIVQLTVDGGSRVTGGDGARGPGGNGIGLTGSVVVGSATVNGGAGTPAGVPFVGLSPSSTSVNAHLQITPSLHYAEDRVSVAPGEVVTATVGDGVSTGGIAFALATALPDGALFLPLSTANLAIHPEPTLSMVIPQNVSPAGPTVFYVQGAVRDAAGGWHLTNAAALRVDW